MSEIRVKRGVTGVVDGKCVVPAVEGGVHVVYEVGVVGEGSVDSNFEMSVEIAVRRKAR